MNFIIEMKSKNHSTTAEWFFYLAKHSGWKL